MLFAHPGLLLRTVSLCLTVGLSCSVAQLKAQSEDDESSWAVSGQNSSNTRNQPHEHRISARSAKSLQVKWIFSTSADVSATPTVSDGAVYAPDWGGFLYAIRQEDGKQLWAHKVSDYDKYPGAIARTSPAVYGDSLIIGDHQSSKAVHKGANIISVDRKSGNMRWLTQVDSHPAAIITGSPVVHEGVVYVGVSSIEEDLATDPTYPCCSFRASMVALDAESGKLLWKTYMVPDNGGKTGGYSGAAIWAQPAIDPARKLLYIGTGNDYTVPAAVLSCVQNSQPNAQSQCFAGNDHFDSAVALELETGHVKWAKRLQGYDIWTVACTSNTNPSACPVPSSPDYDMGGSGANLLGNLVGFGQKSGIYWALNPDTGSILWSSVVGPGGVEGGVEWGAATDGKRIYVPITNSENKPYPLINGTTITWGAWSALDPATGKILWQTADPTQGIDLGALSVANGVVYTPSFNGDVHALDAATGHVLWSYPTGGTVIDGPSIASGTVYWGSGYMETTNGVANNKIYAFSVRDEDE